MDYEKKYKEALALAHSYYDKDSMNAFLDTIFPELRESEDDRIRKSIIECVKEQIRQGNYLNINGDKAIAYLEKQKEQKPNVEICPHSIKSKSYKENGCPIEDCDYGLEIAYDILKKTFGEVRGYQTDDGIREHQTAIKAVRKAKEQKPWKVGANAYFTPEQKPAEKQDYSGLSELERAIHRGFLAAGVENVPVGIIKETAKECLSQMKPAEWSEGDRHYLNSVISLVHNTTDGAWGSCIGDRIETWLKALPERFNLQPKQEWNEEDNVQLNAAIQIVSNSGHSTTANWLKSFRPSWKLSEEQMEALKKAVNKLANSDVADSVRLSIMYDNLKKLI